MPLKVFNTLTKKKELFRPLKKGKISMYVCGPTVYDFAHLGHAKTYIHFDIILRYLKSLGYKVKYVRNITDVGHLEHDADEGEDKIIKRADEKKIDPMKLSEFYANDFFEDMKSLNVLSPDVSPKASEHIADIINFCQELLKNGFAYEINGSVYFDVRKFKRYGALSGRNLKEEKNKREIKKKEEKRSPFDFAIWKKADKKHILHWPSPWGEGYPGWHIECSVMSTKYLGKTIDIHGGAIEIAFPHHENEIAQSEARFKKKFVRYWIHGGLVAVDGKKMSKSLGNFITIKDILKKFSPDEVRFFIASRHYRQPIDFKNSFLEESRKSVKKLEKTLERLSEQKTKINKNTTSKKIEKEIKKTDLKFKKAMDDDFNTSLAINAILEFSKKLNSLLDKEGINFKDSEKIIKLFKKWGEILGLFKNDFLETRDKKIPSEILDLVKEREKARKDKEWEKADSLRKLLNEKKWSVEDTPKGPKITHI